VSGLRRREVAERQGFEPWIPCGIHAFQACAFSHSAISPQSNGLFESITPLTMPFAPKLAPPMNSASIRLPASGMTRDRERSPVKAVNGLDFKYSMSDNRYYV
jgi:hypothetical protein